VNSIGRIHLVLRGQGCEQFLISTQLCCIFFLKSEEGERIGNEIGGGGCSLPTSA
jgi:hypothetical protein